MFRAANNFSNNDNIHEFMADDPLNQAMLMEHSVVTNQDTRSKNKIFGDFGLFK